MSARFEVVRSDAEQPWHARRIVNGRITWWTEQYARKVGAERAIVSLVTDLLDAVAGYEAYLTENEVRLHDGASTLVATVAYVDERTGQ